MWGNPAGPAVYVWRATTPPPVVCDKLLRKMNLNESYNTNNAIKSERTKKTERDQDQDFPFNIFPKQQRTPQKNVKPDGVIFYFLLKLIVNFSHFGSIIISFGREIKEIMKDYWCRELSLYWYPVLVEKNK